MASRSDLRVTRGAFLSPSPHRGNKIVPIPAPHYFYCPHSRPVVIALSPSPPHPHPVPVLFTTRQVAFTLAMFLSHLSSILLFNV